MPPSPICCRDNRQALQALIEENIHPSNNLSVRITTHKNEGIYFYTTPRSDQDLVEAGGNIEPEEALESRIEQLIPTNTRSQILR